LLTTLILTTVASGVINYVRGATLMPLVKSILKSSGRTHFIYFSDYSTLN